MGVAEKRQGKALLCRHIEIEWNVPQENARLRSFDRHAVKDLLKAPFSARAFIVNADQLNAIKVYLFVVQDADARLLMASMKRNPALSAE